MPNILKRPMFSRGGASQGTGVTSGLGRQNFEEKGAAQTTPNPELDKQKAMIDYVRTLKEEAQPTTLQRLGDFMTAFGASKGLDLGGALQDTTAKFQQLQAARQQRADKYGTALDTQLLKIFGSSEKATAAKADAREFAKLYYQDYPGNTYQEKYNNAYRDEFKRQINKSRQRAEKSPETIIDEIAKSLMSGKNPKAGPLDAYAMAKTIYGTRIGDIKIKVDGYIVKDQSGAGGIEDVIIQGDGETAIMNKNAGYKTVKDFEREYVPNKNYLHSSGSIYQYQGGGKFKRMYP